MSDLDRPGLLGSFLHRPAGDDAELPVEGRLAPFDGATGWLNGEPLTPDALRGRVVLVDFWTYTCVNWLRTLPYVRAWAARYAEAGLTVIGVHTPEFGFERDVDNIAEQVAAFEVTWPVAIDSGYGVWEAFANHYWPAVYIADPEGRIRYHHFGEEEYPMQEMVIQQLLRGAGATTVPADLVMVDPVGLEVAADRRTLRSPETYTGYGQGSGFASQAIAAFDRPQRYVAAEPLPLNHWDLTGAWTVARHAAIAQESGTRIVFEAHARDVNLVMGPSSKGAEIPFRVFLDGRPAVDAPGTDVDDDARGVVRAQRTYQLVRQPGSIGQRRFEIEFDASGLEAYCFTFG